MAFLWVVVLSGVTLLSIWQDIREGEKAELDTCEEDEEVPLWV